ncbi:MAG: Arc family DNA-binding protein [Planctomycetota bacterium]
MPERKSFLVRIDPAVLDAVRRWADDDLRSMNGQIEFILRKALRDAGREVTGKTRKKKTKKESGDK